MLTKICFPLSDCDQALGMESYRIPDVDITASSQWDENHASYLARLNNYKSGNSIGAWAPKKQNGLLLFGDNPLLNR